jgi:flagellin-like protein
MMNNKKAVSPLIATVLLIAFAVALGAIVMNWGESFVRETQNTATEASAGKLDCTLKVDFEVMNAAYIEDDTGTNATLKVLIRNAGDMPISEFVAQVFTNTTKGGYAVYNASVLGTLNVKELTFDLSDDIYVVKDYTYGLIDPGVSNITEVRVIPRIDIGSSTGPVSCTSKYDSIRAVDMTLEDI